MTTVVSSYQRLKQCVDIKWPTPAEKEAWWTKFGAVRRKKLSICYVKQNGLCFYCSKQCWFLDFQSSEVKGTKLDRATLEHLLPQMSGGTDHMSNLVMACYRCNNWRGVKDWKEFKENILAYIKNPHSAKPTSNKNLFASKSKSKLAHQQSRQKAYELAVCKFACVMLYSPVFKFDVERALSKIDRSLEAKTRAKNI